MRGTGAVRLNGQLVYAYFTTAETAVRMRVSADEADRLDLFPGLPVGVQLPDGEAGGFLVAATRAAPPFVWLDLVPLAGRTGARAG
jgi:hypothetical protein